MEVTKPAKTYYFKESKKLFQLLHLKEGLKTVVLRLYVNTANIKYKIDTLAAQ